MSCQSWGGGAGVGACVPCSPAPPWCGAHDHSARECAATERSSLREGGGQVAGLECPLARAPRDPAGRERRKTKREVPRSRAPRPRRGGRQQVVGPQCPLRRRRDEGPRRQPVSPQGGRSSSTLGTPGRIGWRARRGTPPLRSTRTRGWGSRPLARAAPPGRTLGRRGWWPRGAAGRPGSRGRSGNPSAAGDVAGGAAPPGRCRSSWRDERAGEAGLVGRRTHRGGERSPPGGGTAEGLRWRG